MCLTPRTYDIINHLKYLNTITIKWIEQAQEIFFDKKDHFYNGEYLMAMDFCKSFYESSTKMKEIIHDRGYNLLFEKSVGYYGGRNKAESLIEFNYKIIINII